MTRNSTASNLNVPNVLTGLRILLVPVLVRMLLRQEYGFALAVFAVAGVTDGLDGFIAKRWNRTTRLGAMLDPVADKLLVVSTVLVLTHQSRIPIWLASAIIARDVIIIAGALAFQAAAGRLEISPSSLSKMNTTVQISTVLLVLMDGARFTGAEVWLPRLFALALVTTVLSGTQYIVVWGLKMIRLSRNTDA